MDIPADIFEIIVCLLADDKQALCSLGLVWKGAIPAIRARRFKNVRHADGNRSRSPISPIIENAPEICVLIRTLSLFIRSNNTQVYPIITNAVNVQDLTFEWLTTSFYNAENLSSCLAQYSSLTTLTFTNGFVEMSSFFSHLHAIPRLTTLTMSSLVIKELKAITYKAWPTAATIYRALWDNHTGFKDCTPFEWDTYDFEAPKPLPNITRLSLTVSNTSDLILLDLISSTKSPFPNVENFTLSDCTGSCRTLRFNGLLQNFKTTLTTLELDEPGKCNWVSSFREPVSLTFPPKVRKFTFDANAASATTIYDNLSSGNLRLVTMRVHLFGHQLGSSHKNAARDEALAPLKVERFNLEVRVEPEMEDLTKLYEAAERELVRNFPLVVAKLRDGSMAGDIIWPDKAAAHEPGG